MGFVKWDDVEHQIPSTPEGRRRAESAIEAEMSGYLLRQLRKGQGLSQEQLAERMGVSQRRVSAIERGEVDRSEVATIRAYVTALGGELEVMARIDGTTTQIA